LFIFLILFLISPPRTTSLEKRMKEETQTYTDGARVEGAPAPTQWITWGPPPHIALQFLADNNWRTEEPIPQRPILPVNGALKAYVLKKNKEKQEEEALLMLLDSN
jgi:hypothetical protein